MNKQLVLHIVLLLSILVVGVSATGDPGEFGASEELIGTAGRLFGYAVAVSGEYALVGQPDDRTRAEHAGAAYVYERRQGHWIQVARLLPSSQGSQGARFGSAVAIDGTVAIVGAAGENNDRGAAYLFERRQGTWTYVHKLTLGHATASTYFGQSVALSGDYAMIGAPGHGEAGKEAGAVYVFQRQQGVWGTRESQKLLAHDARAYAGFGARLALAGPYALVGAPEHDDGGRSTENYGAAYVFELSQGRWREVARLQASDGARRDYFGSAVAITDQEALVGAYGHDGRGAAYLFVRQAGTWTPTEVHKLTTDDSARGDAFGAAVALSGNVILIGAYGYHAARDHGRDHDSHHGHDDDDRDDDNRDDDNRDDDDRDDDTPFQHRLGAAYVFERQAAGWREVEKLPVQRVLHQAHFGYAIALSEHDALIGAPALLGGAPGRVYAYSSVQPNAAPQITSTPVTTATVGTPYRYAVEAADGDDDPLLYALISAPAGMHIDAASGLITWPPTAPGTVTVTVEVHDGRGGRAMQTYTITVSVANQPPQITSTPVTSTEVFHVVPQVTVGEAHLARQTITLNGQPYTPGTPITVDGDYILTVEATDAAGNTSVRTVRFTLRRPPAP